MLPGEVRNAGNLSARQGALRRSDEARSGDDSVTCLSRWIRLSGLVTAGLVAFVSSLFAELSVPTFFSDHMVLQRDMPAAVWGWAEAGESVAVQLGDKPAVTATAGADGTWKVSLPATPARGQGEVKTIPRATQRRRVWGRT